MSRRSSLQDAIDAAREAEEKEREERQRRMRETPPAIPSVPSWNDAMSQARAEEEARQRALREMPDTTVGSVRGAWEMLSAQSAADAEAEDRRRRRRSVDDAPSANTVRNAWTTLRASVASSSSSSAAFREEPDVGPGTVRSAWESIASAFSSGKPSSTSSPSAEAGDSNSNTASSSSSSTRKIDTGTWETVIRNQRLTDQERRAQLLKSELDPLSVRVREIVGEWENIIMQKDATAEAVSHTARVGRLRVRQQLAAGAPPLGTPRRQGLGEDFREVVESGATRVYRLADATTDAATAQSIQRALVASGGRPVPLPCGLRDRGDLSTADVTAVAIASDDGEPYIALTVHATSGAQNIVVYAPDEGPASGEVPPPPSSGAPGSPLQRVFEKAIDVAPSSSSSDSGVRTPTIMVPRVPVPPPGPPAYPDAEPYYAAPPPATLFSAQQGALPLPAVAAADPLTAPSPSFLNPLSWILPSSSATVAAEPQPPPADVQPVSWLPPTQVESGLPPIPPRQPPPMPMAAPTYVPPYAAAGGGFTGTVVSMPSAGNYFAASFGQGPAPPEPPLQNWVAPAPASAPSFPSSSSLPSSPSQRMGLPDLPAPREPTGLALPPRVPQSMPQVPQMPWERGEAYPGEVPPQTGTGAAQPDAPTLVGGSTSSSATSMMNPFNWFAASGKGAAGVAVAPPPSRPRPANAPSAAPTVMNVGEVRPAGAGPPAPPTLSSLADGDPSPSESASSGSESPFRVIGRTEYGVTYDARGRPVQTVWGASGNQPRALPLKTPQPYEVPTAAAPAAPIAPTAPVPPVPPVPPATPVAPAAPAAPAANVEAPVAAQPPPDPPKPSTSTLSWLMGWAAPTFYSRQPVRPAGPAGPADPCAVTTCEPQPVYYMDMAAALPGDCHFDDSVTVGGPSVSPVSGGGGMASLPPCGAPCGSSCGHSSCSSNNCSGGGSGCSCCTVAYPCSPFFFWW